jgi:hypothetical protein
LTDKEFRATAGKTIIDINNDGRLTSRIMLFRLIRGLRNSCGHSKLQAGIPSRLADKFALFGAYSD